MEKSLITTPKQFDAESLIAKAIDSKVPVEMMERLLAMRRELKAEYAKERYNEAMAKFQSECPTITKTKSVATKSGQLAYKYAPIESIVEQVKPYLQSNGFSYSTNMEVLPAGVKVSCKVTHVDGHSETSEMEVPLGERTQIMSASQVTAAASTFAKRYAFCNAFGILTGDEDTDARPMDSIPSGENALHRPPQQPTSDIKPSPAQNNLIKKLMDQKGYSKEDLIDQGFVPGTLTGGKEGTASQMISFLLKAPSRKDVNGNDIPVEDELPVIDVDASDINY